jgi:hypothetical protein
MLLYVGMEIEDKARRKRIPFTYIYVGGFNASRVDGKGEISEKVELDTHPKHVHQGPMKE